MTRILDHKEHLSKCSEAGEGMFQVMKRLKMDEEKTGKPDITPVPDDDAEVSETVRNGFDVDIWNYKEEKDIQGGLVAILLNPDAGEVKDKTHYVIFDIINNRLLRVPGFFMIQKYIKDHPGAELGDYIRLVYIGIRDQTRVFDFGKREDLKAQHWDAISTSIAEFGNEIPIDF